MTLTPFRVVAIPTPVALKVRATRTSPGYGHPAHVEVATGHGPCRHCLASFRVGEERRVLFTWDAFAGVETLPAPGPVFIHEEPCERYREDAGFPADLRSHALTLDAYARGQGFRAQRHAGPGEAEAVLADLLGQKGVDYVHVRDTEAGCFDFRVERAAP